MLALLWGVAALFGWRVLSDRLKRTDAELRTLKARFEQLEEQLRSEFKAEVRPTSAAVPRPPVNPQPLVAEKPREDRDLVADLLRRPQMPSLPAAARPAHATATESTESLETIIGSRWLLYAGIAAVLIGTSYFIKLAFDNHWINETARVLIGGVAGVLLAYVGMQFVRVGYLLYGQVISGFGMAMLYLSIYSAFNFYHLVPLPLAFLLMCVVTIATAWLADRQRSQALALMAVGGGFATPFLLSSGRDAEVVLFTYDAILVGGTMFLARRREWPWLNLLSYTATILTIAAWGSTYYTPDKFVVTEAFLTLFCGLFLYLVYETRNSRESVARQVRDLLWSAPGFYYVGSLAVLYEHGAALLVYLTLLLVVGVTIARQRLSSTTRLVAWMVTMAPLATWVAEHATAAWFTPALAVVAGVYAITLFAQLDVSVRSNHRLDDSDLGLLHASSLAAYGCAYMLIDATHPFAAAPVALAFAVWHIAVAGWLARRDRDSALHFVGIAFTLTSLAMAIQFHGEGFIIGWAAEGAAAIWLGLRERRVWLRAGGAVLLVFSILRLIALQFDSPYVGQMVLINKRALAGAFVVAVLYGVAALYRRSSTEFEHPIHPRDVLLVAANALTLLIITSEIAAFWQLREPSLTEPGAARNGRLLREAMISIAWATYATGLIVAGLRRKYAPIRYFAIVVFGVTIMKVFMIDLASLDKIYRVASVVGLGVLLLVTSYLYQRTRANKAT